MRRFALLALTALSGCEVLSDLSDLTLSPVTITGQTVDPAGAPLRGVAVTVARLSNGSLLDFESPGDAVTEVARVRAGADGRFSVPDRPGTAVNVRYRLVADFCPDSDACAVGPAEVVVRHPELRLPDGEACAPDGEGGCSIVVILQAPRRALAGSSGLSAARAPAGPSRPR